MSNIVPIQIESIVECEIITPNIQRYIEQYKICLKKTADAILSIAETCHDAKLNLSKADFKVFVKEVGLDSSDATLSKYLKIGAMSNRFRKYEDCLPSTWTLLYKLACLDHNVFLNILPKIHSNMTEKDLRIALGKPNNSISLQTPNMTIDLTKKCSTQKRKIYFELQEIAVKFHFSIKLSKEFENEVLNINLQKVA